MMAWGPAGTYHGGRAQQRTPTFADWIASPPLMSTTSFQRFPAAKSPEVTTNKVPSKVHKPPVVGCHLAQAASALSYGQAA